MAGESTEFHIKCAHFIIHISFSKLSSIFIFGVGSVNLQTTVFHLKHFRQIPNNLYTVFFTVMKINKILRFRVERLKIVYESKIA